MRERDRVDPVTVLRRRSSAAATRVADLASRVPGLGVTRRVGKFWQRHVRERPDQYQASITFPTTPDQPTVGAIHGWIEDLEHVFEGRLDVYARRGSITVVTDHLSADLFDTAAFDAVCERIEDGYRDSHSLAHVEKWRRNDGRLVRAHVIVPVKPLFPHAESGDSAKARAASSSRSA